MSTPLTTPRRGRPPRISAAAITGAVIDVGFREVSTPAIAEHLGVSTSTLYGHYPTRDAMVSAAAETVLTSWRWPRPPASWRTFVTEVATGLFELSTAHPGMAAEATTITGTPPTLTRLINDTALVLLDAGLDPADAIVSSNTLIHLSFQALANGPSDPGPHRRREVHENLDDIDERLRDALLAIVDLPPRESLLRSLNLLLDGVQVGIEKGVHRDTET